MLKKDIFAYFASKITFSYYLLSTCPQSLENQQSPEKEVPKNGNFLKSPENFQIPEKRDIVEVSETDYRNNETCTVGDLSEEEEDEKTLIPEAVNITPFPSSIINLVSTSEESAERLAGLIKEKYI